MRTYGVNQASRFEGIWLHRKSRQIQFFGKELFLHFIRAQHVTIVPSYVGTMIFCQILYSD